MDDEEAPQSKVLSQEDVKDFITAEIKEKKKELKDYFEARQKWVQKQVQQLDEEREGVKSWTNEVQKHRR